MLNFNTVQLNPQPLPPGPSFGLSLSAVLVALNPQPLPPGMRSGIIIVGG